VIYLRFQLGLLPLVAHRDGRRSDDQPSLSGHCGHEATFGARRSV